MAKTLKDKDGNIIVRSWKEAEDFIWMSYRYCIGRKTIAAHMHSDSIANLINMNPNMLSDERRKFMAHDIRREVSDRVHWCNNVSVKGEPNHADALTKLVEKLATIPDEVTAPHFFHTHKFVIDFYENEVYIDPTPLQNPGAQFTLNDISDLMNWVRLAEWLDPHYKLKLTDGSEKICIRYPSTYRDEGNFERPVLRYVDLDTYIKNTVVETYYNPSNIVKIEKI